MSYEEYAAARQFLAEERVGRALRRKAHEEEAQWQRGLSDLKRGA